MGHSCGPRLPVVLALKSDGAKRATWTQFLSHRGSPPHTTVNRVNRQHTARSRTLPANVRRHTHRVRDAARAQPTTARRRSSDGDQCATDDSCPTEVSAQPGRAACPCAGATDLAGCLRRLRALTRHRTQGPKDAQRKEISEVCSRPHMHSHGHGMSHVVSTSGARST